MCIETGVNMKNIILIGASRALALELAQDNITVNTIVPGVIYTDNWKKLKTKEEIMQIIPMTRVGEPQDIANAVSFLISDNFPFIIFFIIFIN